MHQFSTGTTGQAGLLGGEPPLSPETIGRAPSNYDAPVALVPLEELVKLKRPAAANGAPGRDAPVPPEASLIPVLAAPARQRVVVRLVGGDELEQGLYGDVAMAGEQARALVAELSAAEQAGQWPEVAGRHLRPASILSVDVLPAV